MKHTQNRRRGPADSRLFTLPLLFGLALLFAAAPPVAQGEEVDQNNPGILEPVTSHLQGKEIRVPNTDQSIDGVEQTALRGAVVGVEATDTTSMLGHQITQVSSPNDDLFFALQELAEATKDEDQAGMDAAAEEIKAILLGTTQGRIYDGFSMLNFNRWKHPEISPADFAPGIIPGEYKMRRLQDTGETFISPFDGEERKIWEMDINMLYYDGQIDSDTFLFVVPVDAHPDDTVRIHYRIYSLVEEDFSPTLVMLDRRQAQNSVNFPFKGFDAVWVAMDPGQVVDMTIDYPPVRMFRGVYTWGWRVHPPRIQFLQPVYEIVNAHTGEVEFEGQSMSFTIRNREELTIETIGDAAPEVKMYEIAQAVLDGTSAATIDAWLNEPDQGPQGIWVEWADLVKFQRQLPPEAWDVLAQEDGLEVGDTGDYQMVSVFLNNEMYGAGPFLNEVPPWNQGDTFSVKLINLDDHTHYFRNVDFGTRLNDDILRCCGGGLTSFEIMNFKPSYGAPKVAEMQWRAGWGFRPHYDVILQDGVFPRGSDRVSLKPYTGGEGDTFFGYQYSEGHRQGDFRFNPPNFIIGFDANDPSTFRLKDADGQDGLVIGQKTEGYGVAQMCPDDPYPGFCTGDISAFNPTGVLNWPPPPLQGQGLCGNRPEPCELRFPPFLRNPSQGDSEAGDIIPPTGAWETFTWINPNNGTIYIDPNDKSKGHWADLTYAHGAPVFAGKSRNATVELPRASGQVFYQFDDLFHDNSIFSPHPLVEGPDEMDTVVQLQAFMRGDSLTVRGRISELSTLQTARWLAVYYGQAGDGGCTGEVLGTARIDANNGRFVYREAGTTVEEGESICVETTVGGYADTKTR